MKQRDEGLWLTGVDLVLLIGLLFFLAVGAITHEPNRTIESRPTYLEQLK